MYVNIYSTDPNADQKFLYNFANVNVMPVIKRIQGMGLPGISATAPLRCGSG